MDNTGPDQLVHRCRLIWAFVVHLISGYCSICQQTENAQIRLHRCARWSRPALSADCLRSLFLHCTLFGMHDCSNRLWFCQASFDLFSQRETIDHVIISESGCMGFDGSCEISTRRHCWGQGLLRKNDIIYSRCIRNAFNIFTACFNISSRRTGWYSTFLTCQIKVSVKKISESFQYWHWFEWNSLFSHIMHEPNSPKGPENISTILQ